MEAGGDVLYLIAATTFLRAIILNDLCSYQVSTSETCGRFELLEGRASEPPERRMIRERLISELASALKRIWAHQTSSPYCYRGLGTVTGMVQVFEAMTYSEATRAQWPQVSRGNYPNVSEGKLQRFRGFINLSYKSGRDRVSL